MDWYDVTTKGEVVAHGVTKTARRLFYTECFWTEEKLLAALRSHAEKVGVTGLRITDFRKTTAPPARWDVEVVDLDKLLGI